MCHAIKKFGKQKCNLGSKQVCKTDHSGRDKNFSLSLSHTHTHEREREIERDSDMLRSLV
jgi:hypothetical protein